MVEDAMRGFRDGLKEGGLAEGTDFTLKTLSAQGDMATLGSLFDSAQTAGTDLYVVFSTPTLQTALQKVRDTPLVFTVVADPFMVGAGKSDTEHLPHVTGVYTQGAYREMVEVLRAHFPQIKRVGTLFCPAEVNSVANKDLFVREATRGGLTVETVPANTCRRVAGCRPVLVQPAARRGGPDRGQPQRHGLFDHHPRRGPGAVAGVHLPERRRPARCRPGGGAGLLRRGATKRRSRPCG